MLAIVRLLLPTLLAAAGAALAESPFAKVDADVAKQSIANSRQTAARAADQLKLKFDEKESSHFLLYTDWNPRELAGLSSQLEQTYSAVAKQFGVAIKDESVFVGKLLVIAVTDREAFNKLGDDLDGNEPPPETTGYFRPHADGSGHLFLCRPTLGENATDAEFQQARDRLTAMLARELTLAFLHRYADKAGLPNWVSRGIAMRVQRSIVPDERIDPAIVRYLASSNFDLTIIFDPDVPANPHFDAASLSLVEMLLERDRQAFVNMLGMLRNGAKPATALEQSFNLTYPQAAEQWRRYLQTR